MRWWGRFTGILVRVLTYIASVMGGLVVWDAFVRRNDELLSWLVAIPSLLGTALLAFSLFFFVGAFGLLSTLAFTYPLAGVLRRRGGLSGKADRFMLGMYEGFRRMS